MLEKLSKEMGCDATQVIINVTESLIQQNTRKKLDLFWFSWDRLIDYLCKQDKGYETLVNEYLLLS